MVFGEEYFTSTRVNHILRVTKPNTKRATIICPNSLSQIGAWGLRFNKSRCLLPPHVPSNLPLSNPELSPEVFPKFLVTVCYDLSHDSETPTERACIAVATVLPPYLRWGLAKHGDWVVHIYKTQCRILPDCNSEKGPVVDTDAQRGAAKHASEIVARTGNIHNMIGALGDAKILPEISMGCETIDAKGRPFTPIVPDESVSDPTLTDSLIPVGRLKEDGFDVSFRIPIEAHIDGVDLAVHPKYGGEIITPKPDSRTIFMEYEDETWRLPKPTVSLRLLLPTILADHATFNIFLQLLSSRPATSNLTMYVIRHRTRRISASSNSCADGRKKLQFCTSHTDIAIQLVW
jgi:hypothetical protein